MWEIIIVEAFSDLLTVVVRYKPWFASDLSEMCDFTEFVDYSVPPS